jgi:hypothetical protein
MGDACRPIKDLGGTERKSPGQDFETAFNALLCYFALGEPEKMKRAFIVILQQELHLLPDDERCGAATHPTLHRLVAIQHPTEERGSGRKRRRRRRTRASQPPACR